MKKSRNYKDFDSLTIYVKKQKVNDVIEHYKIFGWELVNKCENKDYEDIMDITFERVHKIKNKDDLQLMQIYMEDKLNQIGRAERYKHSKSTTFGLILGVLIATLLISGICIACIFHSLWYWVGGAVLIASGLGGVVLEAVILPKIIKQERLAFEQDKQSLEIEVETICQKAKDLMGEENADKKESKNAKN